MAVVHWEPKKDANQEQCLRANILQKRSPKGIRGFRWQKRMFRLYKDRIVYYNIQTDVPLGEIPLVCISEITERPNNNACRFNLVLGKFRTFELQASTNVIANEWLTSIKTLIESYNSQEREQLLKDQREKFWKIGATNDDNDDNKNANNNNNNNNSKKKWGLLKKFSTDNNDTSTSQKNVLSSSFNNINNIKLSPKFNIVNGHNSSVSPKVINDAIEKRNSHNRSGRLSVMDSLLPSDIVDYIIVEELFTLGTTPKHSNNNNNLLKSKLSANNLIYNEQRDDLPPFGKVAIVNTDSSDAPYLLQVVSKRHRTFSIALHTMNTMAKLINPYVITQLRRGETVDISWAIYNFPANGLLTNGLHLFRNVSVPSVRILIAEVICALEYLHKHKLNFPNLSPETIYISHKAHIILTDFGFSLPSENIKNNEPIIYRTGPLCYAPPEFLLSGKDDMRSDWWRLGVLIYHLIVGEPPFLGDREEVCKAICTGFFF